MTILDDIKAKIKKLYETNQDIHITFVSSYPKMNLIDEPAKIVGNYKNIFRVEEYSKGSPQVHTFQYTDIFTKRIEILELAQHNYFGVKI